MRRILTTNGTVPAERGLSALRELVVWIALGVVLAGIESPVRAWQSPGGFENPPLLYDGPDPTANYFLPDRLAQAAASQPMVGAAEPLPAPSSSDSLRWRSAGDPNGPPLTAPLGVGEEPFVADFGSLGEGDFVASRISDYKDGFFQRVGVTETWLDRNVLGIHEIDAYAMFALPAPSKEWPMLITPTFNTRLLDGPLTPDLPAQIYETYLDFLWVPRLSPRWTAIVGVAPSYYGDFQTAASNAFRMTGKGLARYDWNPGKVQLLFGVLYLNRNDIRLLPAGGIIWTPDDARKYELLFPKPKLAHRITLGDQYEDWVYLGGEFGGNTYAIERVSGLDDYVTLRDIRVYVGLERKMDGGAGYRLEAGYVFARRIEYDSATPDLDLGDTAILRGGFTF